MSLYHIAYTSTAAFPFTEHELTAFLHRWRGNNERDAVTGILLYSDAEDRFMQIIEGPEKRITELFQLIEHDYRHRDIVKLADGPISQRHFTAWLMGFHVVTATTFAQLAGYITPTGPTWQQALANTHDKLTQHVLEMFTSLHQGQQV